jgi:hypothetical protein
LAPFLLSLALSKKVAKCFLPLSAALVGVELKTLGAKVQFMVVMLLAKALKRVSLVVVSGSRPQSGLVFRLGAWAIV